MRLSFQRTGDKAFVLNKSAPVLNKSAPECSRVLQLWNIEPTNKSLYNPSACNGLSIHHGMLFYKNKRINRSKAKKMNWLWHRNFNYSVKSLVVVKVKNCFGTKKQIFFSIAKRLRFLVRDAGFELWSSSIEWLTTCILSLYILYFISKCVLFS